MKSLFFRLFLFTFVVIANQSCGGDNPVPEPIKTPEQIATEALTGADLQTWGIDGGGSVARDGVAVTDLYSGFELVLKSGSGKIKL